jgi:hypothetical protein
MLGGYVTGDGSVAIGCHFDGYNSGAGGAGAFAVMGGSAVGNGSIAIGGRRIGGDFFHAEAFGVDALAFGGGRAYGESSLGALRGEAYGAYAIAIGDSVEASGNNSTALGNYVSTNNTIGSFAFGDYSTTTYTTNTADNQMLMRFAGGYKLYTDADATVGAEMAPGGNSWSTISDRRKKENFADIDGEAFLKKIAGFRLTSWNYKGQNPATHRHYGPMAQDFYAAFGRDGYGTIGNDTTINQADMEGVTFTAVQALEKRTQEIAVLKAEIEKLKNENRDLKASVTDLSATLKTEVEQLMSEIQAGKVSRK